MLLEIFTSGKLKADPHVNEDLFLALPGFGYAVIDGLSDRTGHRYHGLSAGQMAARLVAGETANWLVNDRHGNPAALIERLTACIQGAYDQAGITQIAMAEPGRRFGATLALAIDLGLTWRFVLIGDSGIRLNGHEILQNEHPVDAVTSCLRKAAYHRVRGKGAGSEAATDVSRTVTFHGADRVLDGMDGWFAEDDLSAIRATARAEVLTLLPHVPPNDINILLAKGILHGQGHFQNNTESPLSYAVIDGTALPLPHVAVIERPASSVSVIELFTDGYLKPPEGTGTACWEASFRAVEAQDPAKVAAFPCPKGSTNERWFDDRTVITLRLD